jgi:nitroreductase
MDVYQAVRSKRATRQFAERSGSDEVINLVLDAGRRAQSSKNTQPWHFIVVTERERLTQLAALGPYAGHLAGAAFGVLLASPDPAQRWSIAFDLGQAAAYMQLAAWEQGVGSCIGSIYEPEKAREMLGVPAVLTVQVALSFGYSAEARPRPARKGGRKPLSEIAHRERW